MSRWSRGRDSVYLLERSWRVIHASDDEPVPLSLTTSTRLPSA